jgi:hypothetical protein
VYQKIKLSVLAVSKIKTEKTPYGDIMLKNYDQEIEKQGHPENFIEVLLFCSCSKCGVILKCSEHDKDEPHITSICGECAG